MVRPLKQWLLRHRHNPYPTKGEKVQLAVGSNMTLVQASESSRAVVMPRLYHFKFTKLTFTLSCPQVSNWFANARRRLKNVVQESRCSWSKRLRLYNQFVQVKTSPASSPPNLGRTVQDICHNLGSATTLSPNSSR